MNKKAEFKKYRLMQTIKFSSRSGNKIGCSKCWKGVSYNHWRVMSDIVWKLVNYGYTVFTEVEFTNGKRADIVCIIDSGDGVIIEILDSETDEGYDEKLDSYPIEFNMVKVRTKDFDINKWEL